MNGLPLLTIGLLTPTPTPVPLANNLPAPPDPTPSIVASPIIAPLEETQQPNRATTYSQVSPPELSQVSSPEISQVSPPEATTFPTANKSLRLTLPTWQEPIPNSIPKPNHPKFTPRQPSSDTMKPLPSRPLSGGQLYYQRLAALRAGRLYTRLPKDSFREAWQGVSAQPTYREWVKLLALEADAVTNGQGNNRLSVLLGDSLSLWLPSDGLPEGQLWLNQGISGDTTGNLLKRLPLLARTRPDVIYVMAGINDLRQGVDDHTILRNLHNIATRLRQQHPQTRVVMQSILPTRYDAIPADRIHRLNRSLAVIAHHTQTEYMNLAADFSDDQGILRRDLTTDGLHLNPRGYGVWQLALNRF